MTDEKKSWVEIMKINKKIISRFENSLTSPKTRADLANIRKSIGRPIAQSIETWAILFEYMPEEFLSKSGRMTDEEKVILNTVQLYAIHQQGKNGSVNYTPEDKKSYNLGDSLRNLRTEGNQVSVDRRFNTMINSSTFEELVYNLRQMIQLLKSKTTAKIDYVQLSNDLYWFLKGQKETVRLRWAQAFYKINFKEEGEDKNEK